MQRILLGRVRGKVAEMLGENWKGKTGAVGAMLTGLAGILSGGACVAQQLLVEGNLGQWDTCWVMLTAGFGMLSMGFSQFGTRAAVTVVHDKILAVERDVAVVDTKVMTVERDVARVDGKVVAVDDKVTAATGPVAAPPA